MKFSYIVVSCLLSSAFLLGACQSPEEAPPNEPLNPQEPGSLDGQPVPESTTPESSDPLPGDPSSEPMDPQQPGSLEGEPMPGSGMPESSESLPGDPGSEPMDPQQPGSFEGEPMPGSGTPETPQGSAPEGMRSPTSKGAVA